MKKRLAVPQKKKRLAGGEAHYSTERLYRDSNTTVKNKIHSLAADRRLRGPEYNEGERGYQESCFDPVQSWIAFE
jgi:hypothetical protein